MDRKYMIGLDEVSSELNLGYDTGLKNENIAYFVKLLNVKTLRVWLNYSEIFEVVENDALEIMYDGLIRLNNYLMAMKRAGVERFSLLTWGFIYPFNYKAQDKFTVPDPVKEPTIYKRFLKLQHEAVFEISRNFTDIAYFEPTNEPEGFNGLNIHRNSVTLPDEERVYSLNTLEKIVLDLCSSMSNAVKKANPKNKVVFPGFCNFETAPAFVDDIYNLIESGECPSFGNKLTKVDDYFDIINWHPYNLKDSDINDYWFSTIENIRNVMKKHNDISRNIWFNEVGWSDLRRETEMKAVAHRYENLWDAFKDKLYYVETFFPFRLFTLANRCENEGEDNFGLVYNEYDWDTPLYPKPAFVTLYKLINGEDAPLEPLYALAKVKTREVYRYKVENKNPNAYKVLFLGNALTYRKEAPWLGFNEARGLGASSLSKDFAHIVLNEVKKKHKDVQATLVDCYSWEKTFYHGETLSKLDFLKEDTYDLVVISLGDNYGQASLNDQPVDEYYKNLVNKFRSENTKVITTSAFNGYNVANESMKKVAEECNVPYVDISLIKNNKDYLAKNNYNNEQYSLVPNDSGHFVIAKEIIKKL